MRTTPGIYEITSPTGKVYIGQSNEIERRFKTYRQLKKARISKTLYNSFMKHGVANHRFRVIAVIDPRHGRQALDHFEKLFIHAAKKAGYKMLNMTEGGCGSWGLKHTPETVEKLRILGTGENSGMAKRVIQYTTDGVFVKEYVTIADAGRSMGVSPSSINQVTRGITRQSAGFVWRYKGDDFSIREGKRCAPVLQFTIDGDLIAEHESVKAASVAVGGSTSSAISGVCKGKYKSAYGFKWEFKNKEDVKRTRTTGRQRGLPLVRKGS